MDTKSIYLASSALCLSALMVPAAASAQDVEADADQQTAPQAEAAGRPNQGVGTIVVTAQRRAEDVQDVPIAVAAFGGEALQERGITEVAAIANLTPSVQLTNSSQFFSSPSMLSAFIRGIGQDEFSINFEPGVGTYIDGVYLARAAGANVNLMDVERIEILKGPQGTLFGRNTIGGAISVVTRDPSPELGVQGSVTLGRFNRFDVGAIVDVPLADNLLASVAVGSNHRDGWQERRIFPGSEGFDTDPFDYFPHTRFDSSETAGGMGEQSIRAKLMWESDRLTVRLSGDYMQMDTSGTPSTLLGVENFSRLGPIPVNANLGPANAFGANPNIVGAYNLCIGTPQDVLGFLGTQPLFNGLAVDLPNLCNSMRTGGAAPLGSVNVDADPLNDRLPFDDRFITGDYDYNYSTGINFAIGDNWGLNATVDYDLGFGDLKSITAYRELDTYFGQDSDGTPLVGFEGSFRIQSQQFSQELQISGEAFSDRLSYLFGVYYFNETGTERQRVNFPAGIIQIDNNTSIDTTSYAAFAHLNYELSDLLSFTLGGRFTREEKDIEISQRDLNLFYDRLGLGNVLPFPVPTDRTEFYPRGTFTQNYDNFVPRFGIELHPVDDVMIYGSYSRGFKSGGWTTRTAGPSLTPLEFAPEEATTYEIGLKSEFFNRDVQFNLAVFQTDYTDMQIQVQRGISPVIENAGEARIRGVEIETAIRPTSWFRLNASLGYLDAQYLSVDDPTGVISTANMLPKVPEWTFNIAPEFSAYLGNGATVVLRGDYTRRSNMALDSENTPELFTGTQETTNVSLTYFEPGERWSVSVGGSNIFENRYLVNGVSQANGGSGIIYGTPNRPAEYYATFRFNF